FINWFVLWAAGQSQKRIRTKPASDSCEREKTASAWQQRLQRAAIDTAFVSPMARKFGSQGATASQPSFLDSFDKFQVDWNVDEAFIACLSQKFADSRAPSLTIIASKFIHVHANKFIGELTADVARVGKRMAHCIVSMRQSVIDAFADDFAEIVPDCRRNIFAHYIAAKW